MGMQKFIYAEFNVHSISFVVSLCKVYVCVFFWMQMCNVTLNNIPLNEMTGSFNRSRLVCT